MIRKYWQERQEEEKVATEIEAGHGRGGGGRVHLCRDLGVAAPVDAILQGLRQPSNRRAIIRRSADGQIQSLHLGARLESRTNTSQTEYLTASMQYARAYNETPVPRAVYGHACYAEGTLTA